MKNFVVLLCIVAVTVVSAHHGQHRSSKDVKNDQKPPCGLMSGLQEIIAAIKAALAAEKNSSCVAPPAQGEDEAPPSEGEAQPAEGEAQPAEGEAQPAEGEAQPSESEAQPSESEAQPSESEAQPSESEAQPSESEAQPAEGETPPADPTATDEGAAPPA